MGRLRGAITWSDGGAVGWASCGRLAGERPRSVQAARVAPRGRRLRPPLPGTVWAQDRVGPRDQDWHSGSESVLVDPVAAGHRPGPRPRLDTAAAIAWGERSTRSSTARASHAEGRTRPPAASVGRAYSLQVQVLFSLRLSGVSPLNPRMCAAEPMANGLALSLSAHAAPCVQCATRNVHCAHSHS